MRGVGTQVVEVISASRRSLHATRPVPRGVRGAFSPPAPEFQHAGRALELQVADVSCILWRRLSLDGSSAGVLAKLNLPLDHMSQREVKPRNVSTQNPCVPSRSSSRVFALEQPRHAAVLLGEEAILRERNRAGFRSWSGGWKRRRRSRLTTARAAPRCLRSKWCRYALGPSVTCVDRACRCTAALRSITARSCIPFPGLGPRGLYGERGS